ncbi:hypothetical protein QFZ79_003123 [Arthrobacter sp. V4I6]|uniref:hypothetical protein n=1 Tax=unclassified Arthrobacter TaxID=235627 RepID=UPI00277ECC9D|nr:MULTISPECIES: hypothetical protein [unclassified Arthrobacter]MDQ0820750.1 hypothetical protein [Arthrobacter sp. V1I7]MDQ0855012.1 hypothetical protein [Arthrobacter sp. V4I6]
MKKARSTEIAKSRAVYEALHACRTEYKAGLAEKDPDLNAPAAAKLSGSNPRNGSLVGHTV